MRGKNSAVIRLNRNIIAIKTLGALNNASSYSRPLAKGKRSHPEFLDTCGLLRKQFK